MSRRTGNHLAVALYTRDLPADGRLVEVLPEWAEESYPLYAYHHSARLQAAKVRTFLEFIVALTRSTVPEDAAAGSNVGA